ncbi:tRNA endonuclease ANKZF1 [Acipenser ruthenus]|uniref:tRNA endonuclease ANKZF1 n=1 Tax=Acipenser ruthenus TaxID=7906 RepID=UPI0027411417|nr:tRNA endonuclease ANKZF1 [Acipenser ruthenus]XP_033863070.3 tRNA endonuclease ANKZF1 [Acipenser ruthenus]
MSLVPDCRSVFDCPQDPGLLDGLQEVNSVQSLTLPAQTHSPHEDEGPEVDSSKRDALTAEVSERMFCSACQCPFDNREEQIEHYKLDWHRFNLRQRLLGGQLTTAEEFETRTGAGDLSSISGSDSDDDASDSDWGYRGDGDSTSAGTDSPPDAPNRRLSCRVVFRNSRGQYLSVYRCILHSNKMDSETMLAASLQNLSNKSVWVILMTGGGHFAGAVFQGREVLQHKTFHRYTVRAKRGTAQGLRDGQNRSHAPKSAGAALRRYNEAALVKDIQNLLESWSEHLKGASAIFLRAPSYNRAMFIGGKAAPLDRSDPRLRTLPFPTRRATFREIKKVHEILATLHIYGKDTEIADICSPMKKVRKKVSKPAQKEDTEEKAPVPAEESSEEEESPSGELETVELTLGTLELREFEICPRKKRRKKKKGGNRATRGEASTGDQEEIEEGDREESETAESLLRATEEGSETKGAGRRKPRKNKKAQTEHMDRESLEYSLRDALFTACKIGDVATLRSLLQLQEGSPGTPQATEGGGCPVQVPAAAPLLNQEIDSSGFRLLHVASVAGQRAVIRLLLDAGSDPACRDKKGQSPYSVSTDKDTRNEFRKYMADHPDKYDYNKAQVPGPLTSEIELKKAEKKRAQKALKKHREKEQREERKQKEEEELEKRRYAALGEREKRALAAERRLAQQMAVSGSTLSNTRRCWQCGESLLGKIPFEYLDFSFCTVRCLQEHKRSRSTTKP